mgnify:CR=1 FL=1|tara:strand:- start:1139 stop:1696 length:558 start_codon:yes stop_codon:yes gene_type:complete
MRITRVTTKTGDQGTTSYGENNRVMKTHPRVEALGEVDHLNSIIGWVIASATKNKSIYNSMKLIQQDLFNIGGELSVPDLKTKLLLKTRVTDLEEIINKLTEELPPLKEFILPGGNELSSRIHIARTTCRNVERILVNLYKEDLVSENNHLKYINRLSDYLFILARYSNHTLGLKDEHWDHINEK